MQDSRRGDSYAEQSSALEGATLGARLGGPEKGGSGSR